MSVAKEPDKFRRNFRARECTFTISRAAERPRTARERPEDSEPANGPQESSQPRFALRDSEPAAKLREPKESSWNS